MNSPPVAIGGVGGSGTRLIASLLQKAGYYLGDDLNEPLDNLWFTFLLKRRELWPIEQNIPALNQALGIFLNVMTTRMSISENDHELIESLRLKPRLHHPIGWRQKRRDSLHHYLHSNPPSQTRWGWKEPNSHFLLPYLDQRIKGFKYIHVMRHGLDMAASNNQNQLVYWGPKLLDLRVERQNVAQSLSFWCKTHQRVIDFGRDMKERFYLLNFDEFCLSPEEELPKLMGFLGNTDGVSPDKKEGKKEDSIGPFLEEITIPASTGRRRRYPLEAFNPRDVEYVRSLGFDV